MLNRQKTGIDAAIEAVGTQEKLAALVGVTQQNVSVWRRKGYAPLLRALVIESFTGVPRRRLLDPRIAAAMAGGSYHQDGQ